jgi:prepilin signal peptidase PulO-like enzyme (type II secretory pathway)
MNLQIILQLVYIGVLLAVSYTDLREKRIPNKIIVPAIGLAMIAAFVIGEWKTAVLGALFGGGFMLIPVLTLGKRGGMGDVKLAFFMGLILGFPLIVFALIVAHLSAIVLWIGVWLKRLNRKSTVPFGPFLAFGTLIFLVLPYLNQ